MHVVNEFSKQWPATFQQGIKGRHGMSCWHQIQSDNHGVSQYHLVYKASWLLDEKRNHSQGVSGSGDWPLWTPRWTFAVHPRYLHDDVIKLKHFPRNWPFVRGIHRSPVNPPPPHTHTKQSSVTPSFDDFFICAWTNGWVNDREAGD